MTTYTMDQLGGFLRLGQQVYPERPNAVQIIERGPHGQRLAADPVAVRLREPRGSGFRFWVEQMNVPADQSWNPRQRVVGLLGLGATKTEASNSTRNRLSKEATALARQSRSSTSDGLVARANSLEGELNSYYVFNESSAFSPFALVSGPWDSSQVIRANLQLTRQNVRRNKAGVKISAASAQPVSSIRRMSPVTAAALGPAAIAARSAGYLDPEVAAQTAGYGRDPVTGRPRTSAVTERVQEVFDGEGDGFCSREMLKVPLFGSMFCKGRGTPRTAFKNPLLTAAVVVGGGVILYGLARGVGAGVARR